MSPCGMSVATDTEVYVYPTSGTSLTNGSVVVTVSYASAV
jgi:hypothetical protein